MVCVTGQIDDGLVVHGSTLSLRWPGYPNGQQTFCQDGRFVRKTFCQDRLRRFVRKTFCQDRLRRFVRTDLP